MTKQYSRRSFFKNGGVLIGVGAVAGTALAEDCAKTPAQMAGPFYPEPGQRWEDADLTGRGGQTHHDRPGVFRLFGQVRSTGAHSCEHLAGARVEIWQADRNGRYKHSVDESENPGPRDPHFQYWGEAITDANGRYEFVTIEPGKYPGRTPHIHYRIVTPDRQYALITQLYFAHHKDANERDGIYRQLLAQGTAQLVTTRIVRTAEQFETSDQANLPHAEFNVTLDPSSRGDRRSSTPFID